MFKKKGKEKKRKEKIERWREKLQHIRVRTGRLPPNITPRLNGYAKVKSAWHLDLRCLSAC